MSWYVFSQVGGNDKTYLRVTEVKLEEPKNLAAWKIDLKKSLAPGSEQTLQVDVILGKAVALFPEEIVQKEKQLVTLRFSLLYKVQSEEIGAAVVADRWSICLTIRRFWIRIPQGVSLCRFLSSQLFSGLLSAACLTRSLFCSLLE